MVNNYSNINEMTNNLTPQTTEDEMTSTNGYTSLALNRNTNDIDKWLYIPALNRNTNVCGRVLIKLGFRYFMAEYPFRKREYRSHNSYSISHANATPSILVKNINGSFISSLRSE